MTANANNLVEHIAYHGTEQVHIGNGMGLPIKLIGFPQFSSLFSSQLLCLNHLIHVPEITKNLLSVFKFAKYNNVFFGFHPNICLVKDQVFKIVVLNGRMACMHLIHLKFNFKNLFHLKPLFHKVSSY